MRGEWNAWVSHRGTSMSGKDYTKATRTHKITMQALWELLLPQLLTFFHDHDRELEKTITDLSLSEADHNSK